MKQYFDLKGQVALVTGCSGGLGVQMAKALANQGAIIVPVARRQAMIEQVAKEISDEFCDECRMGSDEQVLRRDGALHVDVSFAHLHVRRHAADCGGEVHAF